MSDKALQEVKQTSLSALDDLNLFDSTQLESAKLFLAEYVKSNNKNGDMIKSVSDGLVILSCAKDLKLPFSMCAFNMHVVNGKPGINIHIVKALLTRGHVLWNCTKDYEPIYAYTDGFNIYNDYELPAYTVKCKNKEEAETKSTEDVVGVYPLQYYMDLNNNIYNEFQISPKWTKAICQAHALKLAKEGKSPIIRIPNQPVDHVYEYEFTRIFIIAGKEHIQKVKSRFSYNDAVNAGLITEKGTYSKYPRTMVSHRAFTLGARDIASDLLMGYLETTELKGMNNMPLSDKDFGIDAEEVEIIQD